MATRLSQHRYDTVGRAVEGLARWKGCSVVLEDAHFGLVAYSSHPDATVADSARLRTVLEKRAPKDVVAAMRRRGILRHIRSAREAVRTPALPEVGLSERVVVSLWDGATSYGYLWVEDHDNKLDSEDLKEITAFAAESVLPLLIESYSLDSVRHEEPSNFLRELLQGRAPQQETESWIRAEFFPSVTAQFYLAAVRGDGLPANVVKWQGLSSGGASDVGVGHISTWLDGIAYLLCSSRTIDRVTTFLDGVRQNVAAHHFRGVGLGLSGPFNHLGETKKAASAALRAACVSASFFGGKRLVAEDEYPLVAASLTGRTHTSTTFPNPVRAAGWLQKIADYDRKHGTSLMNSLEQYLDHGGGVSEVASVLHVHPNTLLYRLKRIEQLARINLRNGAERTLIHVELKMWATFGVSQRSLSRFS